MAHHGYGYGYPPHVVVAHGYGYGHRHVVVAQPVPVNPAPGEFFLGGPQVAVVGGYPPAGYMVAHAPAPAPVPVPVAHVTHGTIVRVPKGHVPVVGPGVMAFRLK